MKRQVFVRKAAGPAGSVRGLADHDGLVALPRLRQPRAFGCARRFGLGFSSPPEQATIQVRRDRHRIIEIAVFEIEFLREVRDGSQPRMSS